MRPRVGMLWTMWAWFGPRPRFRPMYWRWENSQYTLSQSNFNRQFLDSYNIPAAQPAYSPNLSPFNFFLFSWLKNRLKRNDILGHWKTALTDRYPNISTVIENGRTVSRSVWIPKQVLWRRQSWIEILFK